ncbi:MAG: ATP-binding protein [Phycisphaeraceae bacterium]|nr:ATP-binding protein [Phycisphaeraceae bacterium]
MSTPRPSNPAQPPMSGKVVVRHNRHEVESVQNSLDAAMSAAGFSKASLFAVRLAFQEAIANAFNHGHKGLPHDTSATVEFSVTQRNVTIAVEDQGPGFQADAVADCTLDENLEIPRGRGVMLIRNYMSEVRYNAKGNRIEMVYIKPAPAP